MTTPSDMSLQPSSPALRLKPADFDAYLPERASSNAFTRPRLELKQRMLAWARAVVPRLTDIGIAMDVTGSDEHPSVRNRHRVDAQRVYFWRDAAARADLEHLIDQKRTLAAALDNASPEQVHAALALKVDSGGVEVSIELCRTAWVDLRNLQARLADPSHAHELIAALGALPEQFSLCIASDADRLQAPRASADELRALVDRCEQQGCLWLGWSVPRDVALAHVDILDEQLEDAIVALGPIYKLIAWAPDNDLLVLDRELDAARAERARHREEAERDRAAWEARRQEERRAHPREHEQHGPATAEERARVEGGVNEQHGGRRPREARDHGLPRGAPKRAASDIDRAGAASDARTSAPRGAARRAPPPAEAGGTGAIEKGTRVRVLSGPFSGKVGVVQELDGKGSARVLLGLLAMWLGTSELAAAVAESLDRPTLTSSHRRPLPSR